MEGRLLAGITLALMLLAACGEGRKNPVEDNALPGVTLQDDNSKHDFNIVLITIDTLRADHLSCYGYERNTSPNIDKIAEEGIIYKSAIAPCSWTAPSMASLFTSLYPINHGVRQGIFYKPKETKHILADELTTLAEILKAHGYTTFGVSTNMQLNKKRGFAKGFDYFKCQYKQAFAPSVNKTIFSWEAKIKSSNKFFLWAHYMDPHGPYHARPPWYAQYTSKTSTRLALSGKNTDEIKEYIPILKKDPQALSNLIAIYDSEINFVDYYIGKLFQRLKLDNNTLIIITADHGEEFFEHDQFTHGHNLFQETIRIPLIVKLPGNSQKKVVERLVNLVDIMPTITELLNIIPPEQTLGKSLLKREGALFEIKKAVYSEDAPEYTFSELDYMSTLKIIMTPEWKYIYDYNNKTGQLYNLKSDPSELNNLIDKETTKADQLKKQLFKWVSNSKRYYSKGHSLQPTPEEIERLKALGYIE